MNVKEFQEHQEQFLNKLLEVCKRKQVEYSDGKNGFHNFENATGFSMHKARESTAWEFCVKHLQSVRDIIEGVERAEGALFYDQQGKLTQEVIDEKFGDIIVYMTLMHGMLTDRINQKEK